jgi:transposase
MAGKRKQHSAAFKAQVALAAHKGDRTVNELASQFGVHPTLIHGWKKQLLAQAETLFANGSKAAADTEVEKAELFEQIGRLKMELEWLKKNQDSKVDWGIQTIPRNQACGRLFTDENSSGKLMSPVNIAGLEKKVGATT